MSGACETGDRSRASAEPVDGERVPDVAKR
jgi:hypothetical protein